MFIVHLGIAACCLRGLFAWISSAAFVVQEVYGYSALAFGMTFALASGGYLARNRSIAARFVARWGQRPADGARLRRRWLRAASCMVLLLAIGAVLAPRAGRRRSVSI